ncbi:hypothetical protein HDU93_004233, partial [Gonapodya sp. JEL0774]
GYVPAPGFLARSLSLSSRFHDPSGFAQALGFPERSAEAARAGEVPVVGTGAEVTDGTGGGGGGAGGGGHTATRSTSIPDIGTAGGGPGHGEWPLFNAVNIPLPSTSPTTTPLYHRTLLPSLITPASLYGKRTLYSVLEYSPLLDSAEMDMGDWIKIARDVEGNYGMWDAFVVLHGTDTMSYTASALSFLLEDLGKPVILTGSQIPLSELRNDAAENLLGALTVASHFHIPEVGLFFDNKLFRGNRTSKVDTVGLGAFASPNFPPLVELGVDIS